MLSVAEDADLRDSDVIREFTDEEIGDFYLLLCRLFPHSDDPEERSGLVTPRRAVVHFRSGILNALGAREWS